MSTSERSNALPNAPSVSEAASPSRHDFLILLVLFVAFRAMTLLAFRPGGLVQDHSDFYWYREFAQLTRQGYLPYVNLWTTYPPLFPFLMIGVWWISTLLPPWEFPNLWFTLLLGGTFLLFEAGNLVLIHAIANRLSNSRDALRSTWFYALLFTPVYTLTGWFESYPLFFFLLGLYLLLRGRPLWSALVCGFGFMIKLIPIVLLPVGLRLARAEKRRITVTRLSLDLDIRQAVTYLGVFVITVVLIGLPFYLLDSRLVWGSLTISNARAPWETVWALLEGRFDYGIIPLDMRDLSWEPTGVSSSLPWPLITLAFAALFAVIYTRPCDWKQPRNVVALSGFAVVLFTLYSKGYSPQWLGWVLIFVALLIPNRRGVFYAVVLSGANLIEGNIFFTIVPDEHWLLMLTVGVRTLVFILVAAECVFVLRPPWFGVGLRRTWHWLLVGLAAALAIGSVPAGMRFVHAYFEVRHQLSPYRATIDTLRAGSQRGAALILNSYDHRSYDWLYPYLRDRLSFYMLDDYAPPGESVEVRTLARLEQIAARHRDGWFFDSQPAHTSSSEAILTEWLAQHAEVLEVRDVDGGRLQRFHLR